MNERTRPSQRRHPARSGTTDWESRTSYRISVVCEDPSHAGKVAKVITLEHSQASQDAGEPDYWWTDNVTSSASERVHRETMRRVDAERAAAGSSGLADLQERYGRIQDIVYEELGYSEAVLTRPHPTTNMLYGTNGKAYDARFGLPDGVAPASAKWVMRCRLCGLDLQRRESEMMPVLDRLMAAGVQRIGLKALISLAC